MLTRDVTKQLERGGKINSNLLITRGVAELFGA